MRAKVVISFVLVFLVLFSFFSKKASAVPLDCKNQPEVSVVSNSTDLSLEAQFVVAKFTLDSNFKPENVKNFYLYLDVEGVSDKPSDRRYTGRLVNRDIVFNLGKPLSGDHNFSLYFDTGGIGCFLQKPIRIPDFGQGGNAKVTSGSIQFKLSSTSSNEAVSLTVLNLPEDGLYFALLSQPSNSSFKEPLKQKDCKTSSNKEVTFNLISLAPGTWEIRISQHRPNSTNQCDNSNFIKFIGTGSVVTSLPVSNTPTLTPTPTPISPLPPCAKWVTIRDYNTRKDPPPIRPDDLDKYQPKEIKCIAINTAIGEISTEPQGFVERIFSLVLGLAGGIALILIMISGYRIMASQGNPEALAAGRSQLIGAIVGLLFIIFSFVILQVIGVDILKIPGFSK